MTLSEIAQLLQEAERGSRELDCEIAVALAGFFICEPRWAGEDAPRYGYIDKDGTRVEPGQGGDMCVPHFTTSLDAALALIEQKLPGWFWECGQEGPAMFTASVWTPGAMATESGIAKTAPLSLCLALVKALQEDGRS